MPSGARPAFGHHQMSSLPVGRYIGLTLLNWLAIIKTLGLFIPWAQVRVARFRAEYLVLQLHGSLDDFVAGWPLRQRLYRRGKRLKFSAWISACERDHPLFSTTATPRRQAAQLQVVGDEVVAGRVVDTKRALRTEAEISEPMGRSPRFVRFGDGSTFEAADLDGFGAVAFQIAGWKMQPLSICTNAGLGQALGFTGSGAVNRHLLARPCCSDNAGCRPSPRQRRANASCSKPEFYRPAAAGALTP